MHHYILLVMLDALPLFTATHAPLLDFDLQAQDPKSGLFFSCRKNNAPYSSCEINTKELGVVVNVFFPSVVNSGNHLIHRAPSTNPITNPQTDCKVTYEEGVLHKGQVQVCICLYSDPESLVLLRHSVQESLPSPDIRTSPQPNVVHSSSVSASGVKMSANLAARAVSWRSRRLGKWSYWKLRVPGLQ